MRIVRALPALFAAVLFSCVSPPDDTTLPDTIDQDVGELRADNAGISATISTARSTFAAADPVSVTLTITNSGRGTLRMLRWQGPSAQLEEPLFAVSREGKAVQYLGAHYKRPPATEEDLLSIAPGQSASQEISLSNFYDFSTTGSYSIRYEMKVSVGTGTGQKSGLLRSNELTFQLQGRANLPLEPAPDDVTTQGIIGYNRCDASQQSLLVQATSNATTYATGALNYLNGPSSATQRYTTWFGTYSSANWSQVRNQFASIQGAFLNAGIFYDCKCKQNYYAYVYPTQPYNIYLCRVFWQAPATGTDSKAGTLIHEMSHFNVTAGTDDWAYGQSAAKSLAISDPAKARNNADSHEYFAENTPALP